MAETEEGRSESDDGDYIKKGKGRNTNSLPAFARIRSNTKFLLTCPFPLWFLSILFLNYRPTPRTILPEPLNHLLAVAHDGGGRWRRGLTLLKCRRRPQRYSTTPTNTDTVSYRAGPRLEGRLPWAAPEAIPAQYEAIQAPAPRPPSDPLPSGYQLLHQATTQVAVLPSPPK